MSFSVGIHLWRPSEIGEQFERLKGVLNCVPAPAKYREYDGSEREPKRFNRVQVFDRCFAEIFDRKIETDRVEDVLSLLEGYQRADVCYVVGSAFNFFDYDQEKDEIFTAAGYFSVDHYGPEYCLGGAYYKTRGSIELSFSNTGAFMVHPALDEKSRLAKPEKESGGDGTRPIEPRDTYNAVVIDLAKKIIADSDPLHLVVCTESEVHPLTAHSVYHRNCQDFLSDLVKIARLHEHGGVYFCELREDDPAFVPPRKFTLDYGYLRGKFGDNSAAAFARKLQPLVNNLLKRGERVPQSRSLVDKCFADLKLTSVENLGDSYLVTALGAPFSYLEEPYFELLKMISNQTEID